VSDYAIVEAIRIPHFQLCKLAVQRIDFSVIELLQGMKIASATFILKKVFHN